MEKCIFYGAGQYVIHNLSKIMEKGYSPLCFADRDSQKWNKDYLDCQVVSLDEALKRYPTARIYISVSVELKEEIYNTLIKYGISDEKIVEAIKIKNGKKNVECFFLRNFMIITDHMIAPCAHQFSTPMNCRFKIKRNDDFNRSIMEYEKRRDSELWQLEMFKSAYCARCSRYQSYESIGWDVPAIRTVDYATSDQSRCNFKCSYCPAADTVTGRYTPKKEQEILDTFMNILSIPGLDNISFTYGEIGILNNCDKIIDAWKKSGLGGRINTNASIYHESISELLSERDVSLVVSLDSGTKETFKKVKGVNCFETVKENLRKYAASGNVILKYIVLSDINDNGEDIQNFIQFAKEIDATVCISADFFETDYPQLTEKQRNAFLLFVEAYRMQPQKMEINVVLLQELKKSGIECDEFPIPIYY